MSKWSDNWSNETVKNSVSQRIARYEQILETMDWAGAEQSRDYILGAIKGLKDAMASLVEDERKNSVRVWTQNEEDLTKTAGGG